MAGSIPTSFEAWFVEHFLGHAVSARPLFILLDGHSTHYQPLVIRLAREHDCIVLCLPPHTTHEAQPLDVGVFAPLKVHWTKVCHEFYQKNPDSVVTKFNFCRIFSKAWCNVVTPGNVMSGFQRAGVFPFNPSAVSVTDDTNMDSSFPPSQPKPSAETKSRSPTVPDLNTPDTVSIKSSAPFPPESSVAGPSTGKSDSSFSVQREELFQPRYEEGYDLFHPEYEKWLKLRHPEGSGTTSSIYHSQPETSLAAHFSKVTPLTQVAVDTTEISQLFLKSFLVVFR